MLNQIETKIAPHGLIVMGALLSSTENNTSLILIGAGAGFWPVFTRSPEYLDGDKDPIDRWSKRIIGGIAPPFEAEAIYPSDGPPYAPFISWAIFTGRFFQSPTGMMVHDTAGLMISIRGALKIPAQIALPSSETVSPCTSCVTQPCLTACPVDALSSTHSYDVPVCKAHLRTPAGADCMNQGCRVRRACPVSQSFERKPEQSAFHMKAFLGS